MKKALLSAVCLTLWCVCAGVATAQEMNEVDQLSFGTFAVANNDMPRTLVVTPDNDTLADTGIVVGANGQRGVYDFTGLPPDTSFFIGVDMPNPPNDGGIVFDDQAVLTYGGGPAFTVDTFDIGNGGILQTDGAGNAMLTLGATLRTSGNGAIYNGGTYVGQASFTLYY